MPTCQVSLRPLLHPHPRNFAWSAAPTRRRAFASGPAPDAPRSAAHKTDGGAEGTSAVQHTLTLLYRTRGLVPRVLPSHGEGAAHARGRWEAESESGEFWEEVLNVARGDLERAFVSKTDEGVRVVVYGPDEHSGAWELVTALLEDPLVPESHRKAVRDRWEGRSGPLTIRYGPEAQIDGEAEVVTIPSAWLRRFNISVEVQELSSPPSSLSPPPSASRTAASSRFVTKKVYAADIPIIVLNPLTYPGPSLLSPSSSSTGSTSLAFPIPKSIPNALTVLTTSTPIPALLAYINAQHPHTLLIDPARALDALHTLNAEPASALAVQRFQDDFVASRLGSLTKEVEAILSPSQDTATKEPRVPLLTALRIRKARALIDASLEACETALRRAKVEVCQAADGASALEGQMEEAKVRVPREVFGSADEGEVQRAVKRARREVGEVLDALKWWKLVWRVDDVGEVVKGAVERAWCRDLERKLVYHTGRLAALQQTFTQHTTDTLAAFPAPSPLYSPLLHNALSQLTSSPSFPLPPTALTSPLHTRLAQLNYPIARLHAAAQRAVLAMAGSSLGGLGVAWAGWVGHVGALEIGMGASVESAVGLGMLGAMAGVRWAVGRWERAKRGWWRDWDRVGEGLERDLKTALDKTLEERVFVVPRTASEGLEELARKRKLQIEELQDEVTVLKETSSSAKPSPP